MRTLPFYAILIVLTACATAYFPPNIDGKYHAGDCTRATCSYIGTLEWGVPVATIDSMPVGMVSIAEVYPGTHKVTFRYSGASGLTAYSGVYSTEIHTRAGGVYEIAAQLIASEDRVQFYVHEQDEHFPLECTATHRASFYGSKPELEVCDQYPESQRGPLSKKLEYMKKVYPIDVVFHGE